MERLSIIRKAKNTSGYALSKDLGITPAAITRLEQGKSKPSVDLLQKLADYFGVTTDYLLGREKSFEIAEEDRQLLERIHSLTTVQKNTVKKIIDSFTKKNSRDS